MQRRQARAVSETLPTSSPRSAPPAAVPPPPSRGTGVSSVGRPPAPRLAADSAEQRRNIDGMSWLAVDERRCDAVDPRRDGASCSDSTSVVSVARAANSSTAVVSGGAHAGKMRKHRYERTSLARTASSTAAERSRSTSMNRTPRCLAPEKRSTVSCDSRTPTWRVSCADSETTAPARALIAKQAASDAAAANARGDDKNPRPAFSGLCAVPPDEVTSATAASPCATAKHAASAHRAGNAERAMASLVLRRTVYSVVSSSTRRSSSETPRWVSRTRDALLPPRSGDPTETSAFEGAAS